jgi:broad specificity phosphatase PhoE
VPIYLIRHGHAGSRTRWDGDDSHRPLNAKGRSRAERLAGMLVDEPVGRLYSSPSRRCCETLEPLARRTGLAIETVDDLDEGAGGEVAERFLRGHAGENPAVCSHGDVIPRVLHRLHAAGMRAACDTLAAKGSMWVLDLDTSGAVVRGTYHPPPD